MLLKLPLLEEKNAQDVVRGTGVEGGSVVGTRSGKGRMLDQYQYVTNGPWNTSIREQSNWTTTIISESTNVAHD
jgi:hypothetical protein